MPGQSGSETRKMDESIRVRLRPEDRTLIERKARRAGVTLSEFMRRAALNREIRSVADHKAVADLNRLGGLLKWWLTDGKGKDGERHLRGKAPPDHALSIDKLLRAIDRAVLRVIAGQGGFPDEDALCGYGDPGEDEDAG